MSTLTANVRKAAILIRSLDTDTAAGLLAQLSPGEAKAVRVAIQALGPVEDDERDDVAAEFRRIGPLAAEDPRHGVELELSAAAANLATTLPLSRATSKPFEFLEHARVEALVPYLAREHGQTVAIVLSCLQPSRAAEVLVALPPRLQVDVVERLSVLGETDPGSVQVLERELADWLARQQAARSRDDRRTDSVAAILAAADAPTRSNILANVAKHNHRLAEQISPRPAAKAPIVDTQPPCESAFRNPKSAIQTPRPTMPFDDLARLDKSTLASVLRAVDADLVVLALAGASDELVERIAESMPRPTASAFRRRLRQLGPTRLRDVEAAQQEVAAVATRTIQTKPSRLNTVVG